MKTKLIITTLLLALSLTVPGVFATDTPPAKNDVQAAAAAALDELYNSSLSKELIPEGSVITLSEGLPCVFSTNFYDGMSFNSIKTSPDAYFFSFYVNGSPGGYAQMRQSENGFISSHIAYSETEYAETLKSLEYDDVVLINDWRDEYYLIRNDGEEYIVPGLMRNYFALPMPLSTEYGLSEIVNAIEYRNEFHPIDPKIVGGSNSDAAWQYIGLTEKKQTEQTLIIIVYSIGIVLILVAIFLFIRKKRKNISK